tara:strand:+ start:583 stop:861 length:279 start_codon:yes stop_codon:yes gene_type:complete
MAADNVVLGPGVKLAAVAKAMSAVSSEAFMEGDSKCALQVCRQRMRAHQAGVLITACWRVKATIILAMRVALTLLGALQRVRGLNFSLLLGR